MKASDRHSLQEHNGWKAWGIRFGFRLYGSNDEHAATFKLGDGSDFHVPKLARDAIDSVKSPLPDGEAVAWRFRDCIDDRWTYLDVKPAAEHREVQPLYSSPPPVSGEVERLQEQLVRAQWRPIAELPETDPKFLGKGINLLLFSPKFGVRTGEAFNAHGRKWANVGNLHGNAIDDWGATHWMYLPDEPHLTDDQSTKGD